MIDLPRRLAYVPLVEIRPAIDNGGRTHDGFAIPARTRVQRLASGFRREGVLRDLNEKLETSRIIVNEQEEMAQTPPPAAGHGSPVVPAVYTEPEPILAAPDCDASAKPVSEKVAKLFKEYQRACAEGRYAVATQLAVQALAIDPACFSKTNVGGKKSSHCLHATPTRTAD